MNLIRTPIVGSTQKIKRKPKRLHRTSTSQKKVATLEDMMREYNMPITHIDDSSVTAQSKQLEKLRKKALKKL